MRLEGKCAVITGSNRGIGLKIAEKMFCEGADVIMCARKSSDEFTAEMERIKTLGREEQRIFPIYFDMENEDEIKQAAKSIISQKLPVDILVNNAGITARSTLQMQSMDELRRVYNINFFNMMYFTQFISRYMIRKKQGSIINISSISGIDNAEGTLAYGGSKASVAWSTKTLAIELGQYNIRVNSVAPGLIETDMINYKSDEQKREIIKQNCIKRMGTTDDVANAVVFLASGEASFITGQTLRVDGGRI